MSYNVFFDLAALCSLAVLLFTYKITKHLPELKNKLFVALSLATFVSTTVDFVSAEFLLHHSNRLILWGSNIVYFVCVLMLPCLYAFYTLALVGQQDLLKTKLYKALFFLPIIIALLMVFATPFSGLVFTITPEGIYQRNFGVLILYVIMLYYMVLGCTMVLRFGSLLGLYRRLLTLSFTIISLIAVVIQFIVPNLLVQHFGVAISLQMIFYALQNSDMVTDGTTGVLNVKSFDILIERQFRRNKEFGIVAVNLEDLDFLISTFGINNMDVVLKQIVAFLQDQFDGITLFRTRTDSFTLVFEEKSETELLAIAQQIKHKFETPWKNGSLVIKVHIAECIIMCPKDGENTQDILDIMGAAFFDLRYKGKGILLARNIDVSTRKRFSYVEELVKSAIQENRIEVYYQPIFSTEEQRIVGAEALIRMHDREGGFISPDEFVPIAEQNGLILRIGEFVFEDVCRFIALNKIDRYGADMIDINLSVAQCMQTELSETLIQITNDYNLEVSQINLEITETVAAHTPELLQQNMDRLTKLGFACSLDDYGSGYANLNYILKLPFSMIKIDKEIVWSTTTDIQSHVVLTGIIDMMHKLNMKIVAEGVETEEMKNVLTELKCNYLQGYYFSRPVPGPQFLEIMKKQAIDTGYTKFSEQIDEIFPEELYPEAELEEL
ncbi:MAG: EAL domain-containing protein [Treponema sp.]|nr:EAL domain-containing protein [Treponema sp.]